MWLEEGVAGGRVWLFSAHGPSGQHTDKLRHMLEEGCDYSSSILILKVDAIL